MLPGRRPHRAFTLSAGLLLALFLLHGFLASRVKSAVYDEPGDIAAGLSYLQTGEVRVNPQHPPLLKELAGLSVWLAGIRLPGDQTAERMLAQSGGERIAGNALLAASGPDRVMFWARLPFLLLSTALGLAIYLWGRQLLGDRAALCALFLYTLDPTILAHSSLATMDAGLAAFTLLFLFALWNYLQRPGGLRLLLCGVALGCLLAAKFTAVLLLPVAAVLVLAAVRWPARARTDAPPLFPGLRGYAAAACAFFSMCLVAAAVVQLLYLSPGGLFRYTSGMASVNADHRPDYLVFLAGHLAHDFTAYFAVAWLLKEPIASLLLTGIGLAALRGKSVSRLAKLFLLFPPVALFAAHTVWADDLGIRYIIPALPFAYLVGGAGAAWLIGRRARWARPLAAALGVWMAVVALGVSPDHMSYFNEAACLASDPSRIGLDGGSRCGPSWLDDSNVDWGQGLKQLKDWLDRHPSGQPVRVAYIGPVAPETYGLRARRIELKELVQPPKSGRVVVSAHLVARFPALTDRFQPGAADWLRRPPAAVVAHAWYVFDIP
jgi:hypothetical protein